MKRQLNSFQTTDDYQILGKHIQWRPGAGGSCFYSSRMIALPMQGLMPPSAPGTNLLLAQHLQMALGMLRGSRRAGYGLGCSSAMKRAING